MLKWYGDIYSTAIPKGWTGAVIFKIKKQTIVGIMAPVHMNKFAASNGGRLDGITGLWVFPVLDMAAIGKIIKNFEQEQALG